jgi:transcriptional regulator with XRE-family HTH domain
VDGAIDGGARLGLGARSVSSRRPAGLGSGLAPGPRRAADRPGSARAWRPVRVEPPTGRARPVSPAHGRGRPFRASPRRARSETEAGPKPGPGPKPAPAGNRRRSEPGPRPKPSPARNRGQPEAEAGPKPAPAGNRGQPETEAGRQPRPTRNRGRPETRPGPTPGLTPGESASTGRYTLPCQAGIVDPLRFGRAIRALRRRRRYRQEDLGSAANVSRSMIARLEAGQIDRIPLGTLRAVGAAVGADVDILARWHGEGLDRLLDEAHAAVLDVAVELFRAAGWTVAVEATFAIRGERGSIDLLAWHEPTGLVAVDEIKSIMPDASSTVLGLDRKTRLAPVVARERGWSCRGVARFLIIGEGRTARRRVEGHESLFGAAFPVRGRAAEAWIRAPAVPPISGLLFVRPRAAGAPSSDSRRVTATARPVGRERVRRPRVVHEPD